MMKSINRPNNRHFSLKSVAVISIALLCFLLLYDHKFRPDARGSDQPATTQTSVARLGTAPDTIPERLDTSRYNALLLDLAHQKPTHNWPAKAPLPLAGAVLPFHRIVAYYGNFYSKGMGILGELPEQQMIQRLKNEVQKWQQADPGIPVLPAIHYVAVTAQRQPGPSGMYRLRMPHTEIDKALALARQLKGLLFLDVQVGQSNIQDELPPLMPYLQLPDVHLGIDPEYSMKTGQVPCSVIGSFDAVDINHAATYLAGLVRKIHCGPKILVVHRFTSQMVTNYRNIITRPEVQIVMNMDGFGFPAKKIDSYQGVITKEPVQFTGFKLFYRNDLTKGYHQIMQPAEVLALYPAPIYIQYQ
ncbi:hypothetical protein LL912_02530 [Niabella sp. CC-SYL272]|uniref:hypothetical protein n=1 Tax=Niabella agricola TaxID=2891571 RepID=UPI001F308D12|nr:hypothetical protein [Niabella agricola]MCF3107647.1 hypothetical protein [Niabella agricola]